MNMPQLKFLKSSDPASAKNKKMIIMMPVLILVFIFVLTRALKQPASCSAIVQNPVSAKSADANTHDNVLQSGWQIPEVYPANLRDPMHAVSTVADTGSGGDIIVKGIMYSHDRPSAVINDRIMHQGDKIGGVTIIKINKNNVEFEMNSKTWTQQVQH
ncbi:MAG: hypothetical protein BWY69_00451 [Planctomycetes bacterium ADurb.Bin401]|nr:MAG: hypothetical protein BWY69_00451 [Planctomycetes bacterium ADurb.Bin401]